MKILYKKLIKIFFEIFYGKIQLPTKNKLDYENFKIIKLKCFNKAFKLYKINQGKIFTDCNTNVAYITKNNLITNFSYQQNGNKISSIKYNSVLQFGTPKIRKNIRGSVLSLIQGASGQNYFHWLFDLLPKIEVLNNQKKLKKIDYFFVPNMARNIIETLKVYGIRENQLIDSQKYKHVKADQILFLENIYLRNGIFKKQFGRTDSSTNFEGDTLIVEYVMSSVSNELKIVEMTRVGLDEFGHEGNNFHRFNWMSKQGQLELMDDLERDFMDRACKTGIHEPMSDDEESYLIGKMEFAHGL